MRNSQTLIFLCLFVMIAACGCVTRGFPAQWGIVNFDRVDEQLYRGGRVNRLALEHLQSIGVKSVVNLRDDDSSWPDEQDACHTLGMVYTNFPMSSIVPPSRATVVKILNTMQALPKPIFVHCLHGSDRTGLIVACWRINEYSDWTPKEAAWEAKEFGASPLLPGFRKFILDFKPIR